MTTITQPQSTLGKILQKKDKTPEEVKLIYENMKAFHFFNNFFSEALGEFNEADMLELCKGFSYEQFEGGDIVFEKGDPSNEKFYIIISGQVAAIFPHKKVLVRSHKAIRRRTLAKNDQETSLSELLSNDVCQDRGDNDIKEPQIQEEAVNEGLIDKPSSLSKLMSLINTDDIANAEAVDNIVNEINSIQEKPQIQRKMTDQEELENLIKQDFNKLSQEENDLEKVHQKIAYYGKVVKYMGQWDSFGEIALRENKPRLASIICVTGCEFLIINKEQFDHMFLHKELEKIKFAKAALPFLHTSSSCSFQYLMHAFKVHQYEKGSLLTTEDEHIDRSSKIFLIYEGKCIVEKNFVNAKAQVQHNYHGHQHDHHHNHHHDHHYDHNDHHKPIQIAVIGKGELAGEEVVNGADHYVYSIRVLSKTAIVYTISKGDFEMKLLKEFSDFLTQVYKEKKERRDLFLLNQVRNHEYESERSIHHDLKVDIPCINNMNPVVAAHRSHSFRITTKLDMALSHLQVSTVTTRSDSRSPRSTESDDKHLTPVAFNRDQTSVEDIVAKKASIAIRRKLHIVKSVDLKGYGGKFSETLAKNSVEEDQKQSIGLIELYTSKRKFRRSSFFNSSHLPITSPKSASSKKHATSIHTDSHFIPNQLIESLNKSKRKSRIVEESFIPIAHSIDSPSHSRKSSSSKLSSQADEQITSLSNCLMPPTMHIKPLTTKHHSAKDLRFNLNKMAEPIHSLMPSNFAQNTVKRRSSFRIVHKDESDQPKIPGRPYLPAMHTTHHLSSFSEHSRHLDVPKNDNNLTFEKAHFPTCPVKTKSKQYKEAGVSIHIIESDFGVESQHTLDKSHISTKTSQNNIESFNSTHPNDHNIHLKQIAENHRRTFKKTCESPKIRIFDEEFSLMIRKKD